MPSNKEKKQIAYLIFLAIPEAYMMWLQGAVLKPLLAPSTCVKCVPITASYVSLVLLPLALITFIFAWRGSQSAFWVNVAIVAGYLTWFFAVMLSFRFYPLS